MRKVLLISLAAVILAGGTALVVYAQAEQPRARGERVRGREGGPPADARRGGPPRVELNEGQRVKLATLMKGDVGKDLKDALAAFQAKVMEALNLKPDDERTARMITMRAIMGLMRPQQPGEEGKGPRGQSDRPAKGRRRQ